VLADRGFVRGLVGVDDAYELALQLSKNIGGLDHGHGRGAICRGVAAPTVHVLVVRRLQRIARLTHK
jgi:hypothetical protein